MTELLINRLLSMSVFEAAHALRTFRRRNPDFPDSEIVEVLRTIRANVYAFDYEAGLYLEKALPHEVTDAPSEFFRACIDVIILKKRPLWMRLVPGGREQAMQAAELNTLQCFRAAGLLDVPVREEIQQWWDSLAARVRADRDASLLAQGRLAERWSFDREVMRLADEGINRQPVWVAIEDNSLGYDILSYTNDGNSEINRLIEVKSTRSVPPRLILTKNEWTVASQYGDALEFHLWEIEPKKLRIFSPADISQHIPTNNGDGDWLQVEISF